MLRVKSSVVLSFIVGELHFFFYWCVFREPDQDGCTHIVMSEPSSDFVLREGLNLLAVKEGEML